MKCSLPAICRWIYDHMWSAWKICESLIIRKSGENSPVSSKCISIGRSRTTGMTTCSCRLELSNIITDKSLVLSPSIVNMRIEARRAGEETASIFAISFR